MCAKQDLRIRVSGYVSEVICGRIPRACKDCFADYIYAHRKETAIAEWLKRRYPRYVTAEEIKDLWYLQHETMSRIFTQCAFPWKTYRDVDDIAHYIGFGTGKDGLGLFEIRIHIHEGLLMEFVPFDPLPEKGSLLRNMTEIPVTRLDPEPAPTPEKGKVAVSAGSWEKGAMEFRAELREAFVPSRLEILLKDLTSLGVGEDHYVAGFRYAGKPLSGQMIRVSEKDFYHVLWYDRHRNRWLAMYE